MKRRHGHGGLVALNAALVAALAAVSLAPDAGAQRGAVRENGEYTMVGGRAQGLAEAAIYVVDGANEEMIALRWDRSGRKLVGIGHRDLKADAESATGGGR